MVNNCKRAALNGNGWVRLEASDLVRPSISALASLQFKKLFENLPVDPYCASKTRYRRFAEFEVDPVLQTIEALPAHLDQETGEMYFEYFQNKQVNPDDGGLGRRFPAVDLSQCDASIIKEVIWNCYELTEWETKHSDTRKIAGFHAVSYQPGDTDHAVASPNVFHQDGEPYTFGILIGRSGVNGGENYIGMLNAANKQLDEIWEADIIAKFALQDTFEAFGVCDRMVTHYVAPLTRKKPQEKGFRNIILLDFSLIL